jgi:uncharacterized membrane protein
MGTLFANYGYLIVFTHVLSAFIWVGGMIAIRIAVHPVVSKGAVAPEQMHQNDVVDRMLKPHQRLGMTLQITGKLFNLVMLFIGLLFVTGLIMTIAMNGHHGELKSLFITKEIIWTLMAFNFAYMYFKRAKAWKYYVNDEIQLAKAKMKWIPNVLLPLNIVLGVIALGLGVTLRGL